MKTEEENFYTYLPVQLDATCNGYKHLSLLAQEKSIYKELNLEKTSKKKKT
jgi:DNA-directed RNA polymerase